MRLIDELNDLHDHYVRAINQAVTINDFGGADRLAAAYDNEAIRLIAEREGKTHLLPLQPREHLETPLRQLVQRLRAARAA